MDKLLHLARDNELVRDAIISVAWVAGTLMLRAAAERAVRSTSFKSERVSLRWRTQIRTVTALTILGGLVLIWATELRTMALSLAAIAVAIVVGTKEMLLCVMGSIVRTTSRAFSIGDRIEIEGVRGDVIDHGLFTTTILEIGPGHLWTGRAVTLPNALFLSGNVVNESFAQSYVLHIIRVPVADDAVAVNKARKALLAIGKEVCDEFLEKAREYLERNAETHGFEPPDVEPTVSIALPEVGKLDLLLRIPTPARMKGDIEQRVLRAWLDAGH